MKKFTKLALATTMGLMVSVSASASASLNGTTWQSVDEKGNKKAVIKFTEKAGVVSGKIIKLNDESKKNAVCKKCTGNLKNQKIQGMRIIWGLKSKSANKWDGGKLVDPESGKIYKGKVTLNGNTLKLRGYVGFSALGRSQTWTKIK